MRRLQCVIALALVAGLLTACGSDEPEQAPLGSESNPVKALPNPSKTRTPPDQLAGERAEKAAQAQDTTPAPSEPETLTPKPKPKKSTGSERKQKTQAPSASRPCSLVTKSRAEAFVGKALRQPVQAPQGPTCIYQTSAGKQYVTLAVQETKFSKLRKQMRKPTRVAVSSRTGYCGVVGRPALYVRLSATRVLTVSAQCAVAKKFAAQALQHL